MKSVCRFALGSLLTLLILMTGCGGGSGGGGGGGTVSGIGGTGKIATGTITGFGSIFVNDIEYELADASITVDGNSATENDLRIGMVVTVTGVIDGTKGIASSVAFDDDIQGPVNSLLDDGTAKRFSVLGTDVVVDATTTVFEPGISFETVAQSDVVELSGFFDGDGVLNATYVKKAGTLNLGTTEVELKGVVSGAPPAGAGAGDSFTLDGITVNILSATDISDVPGGMVTNDMYIEARGLLISDTEIDASKIGAERSPISNNEEDVSIEGLVSGYVDNSNFHVAGQLVNASSATLEPASLQLADGLRVEVEGPIVNGEMIAEKVKAKGGVIKINAAAASTSLLESSIALSLGIGPGNLVVRTDADTKFKDETKAVKRMALADIQPDDRLEIRAYEDGSGSVIATRVNRCSDEDVVLQGPAGSFDAVANTITILGIVFQTDDALTEFEDANESSLSGGSVDFYKVLSVGDILKIEDKQPADGIADVVDIE